MHLTSRGLLWRRGVLRGATAGQVNEESFEGRQVIHSARGFSVSLSVDVVMIQGLMSGGNLGQDYFWSNICLFLVNGMQKSATFW